MLPEAYLMDPEDIQSGSPTSVWLESQSLVIIVLGKQDYDLRIKYSSVLSWEAIALP